jgi:hypothetical protein
MSRRPDTGLTLEALALSTTIYHFEDAQVELKWGLVSGLRGACGESVRVHRYTIFTQSGLEHGVLAPV